MEAISDASPLGARIHIVRGQSVMLDSDLAEVYEVETGALNRAVDRNAARFPDEFAFRLTAEEWEHLKCQIGISSAWGGRRRALPRVFTEYGATALSMILKSERAVAASIRIIQAFVHLRRVMAANHELAQKIDALSARVGKHDKVFVAVFEELKRLAGVLPPETPKGRIGYRTE